MPVVSKVLFFKLFFDCFFLCFYPSIVITTSLRLHPLDLVGEVKVWLVEVMHTHVSILSTGSVASTLWVNGNLVTH